MADLLSEDDIRVAVGTLTGWEYDGSGLVRAVPVEDADRDSLERAVMAVADELNHHPVLERSPGRLTLRVWTHSAGGVTSKDVDLASRLDQVLSGTVQD
jgi:4a-hydroxytetrahydrobiopterin dehydratase